MLAAQAIRDGDAEIVIAGGQENMSASPHVLPGSRDGLRMGDWKLVDTMIVDGLWDVYNQYHMGITAENVAKKYEHQRATSRTSSRSASQQKAAAAQEAGTLQGRDRARSASRRRKGDPIVVRRPTSSSTARPALDALAGLRPAFDKAGSVTAGNASGLNDGAAAVLVMTAKRAAQLGLTPLGRDHGATPRAALDPAIMGMGPVPASQLCLEKAGWKPAGPRPAWRSTKRSRRRPAP